MQTRKINQWNVDLRNTLKGQLEHRLFLMWAMADNDDEADKYMQRLLDVRFERKKCEAYANEREFLMQFNNMND